jgi:hypothetical protein
MASMRLMKIHLRAALDAADGDVERAARMLGLTSADAARLLANDSRPPPPGPTATSGTWTRLALLGLDEGEDPNSA